MDSMEIGWYISVEMVHLLPIYFNCLLVHMCARLEIDFKGSSGEPRHCLLLQPKVGPSHITLLSVSLFNCHRFAALCK